MAEMLVTVAILGVMVTMVLPSFGSTEPARQGVNKQNAQNCCTLAFASAAAGVDLVGNVTDAEPGSDEVKEVIQNLVEGVTITRGPLAGKVFRLPNLEAKLVEGASRYVAIRDGEIVYNGGLDL